MSYGHLETDEIEELDELSTRTQGLLKQVGITTIGDLISRREDELLEIRWFSNGRLTEVKEALDQYGFTLRTEPHGS